MMNHDKDINTFRVNFNGLTFVIPMMESVRDEALVTMKNSKTSMKNAMKPPVQTRPMVENKTLVS